MRLAINQFLTVCYGVNWWDVSLKVELPVIYNYAEEQENRRHSMPWIGASARVPILRIHLVTLGQLEEIVKKYRSDCIPALFPTLEFSLVIWKLSREFETYILICFLALLAMIAELRDAKF